MFPLRDENPSHGSPFLTVLLIAANVAAFFGEVTAATGMESVVLRYGMVPRELLSGEAPAWTVMTSMFLHGGIGHLVGNMWFLWIFGDNLEEFLGRAWYLLFYLGTGIVAAATHVALNPDSPVPTIGASGAVSGILGGYLVVFPKIRVRTLLVLGFFFDVVRVPAVMFLGLWFVMQLMGGLGGDVGIAFGAHVGGFVAGAVLMLLCSRRQAVHPHTYDAWRAPRLPGSHWR